MSTKDDPISRYSAWRDRRIKQSEESGHAPFLNKRAKAVFKWIGIFQLVGILLVLIFLLLERL